MLYGGSAVALYLGHRESVEFDFFTHLTLDYLDVDALLRNGLSLSSGLAGARILFPAFAPQECLKALTYFEDESLRDLPQDLEERLLNAVKNVRSLPIVSLASSTLID